MLIGTDYFGLHSKEEVVKAGKHLSIMKGELVICLVGTHPLLVESTQIRGHVPGTLHLSEHRFATHHGSLRGEHPAFMEENFIVGGWGYWGLSATPSAGAANVGNDLSFREEQELHRIRSDLVYDAPKKD